MTADFGTDFYCMNDLDEALRMVSGVGIVIQAAYHRLTTTALIDDEDFGIDVRALLGRGYTADTIATIQPQIDAALQRDDRILTTTTRATLEPGTDANGARLTLDVSGDTAAGPFRLVFAITEESVSIIAAEG